MSVRDNTHGLYRRAADGRGNEERLYQHTTGAPIVLTDWSADGRFLCFWSGDTMFVLPLPGDRKPIELKGQEFFGRGGRLLARQPFSRVQLEPVRPLSDLRQAARAVIDRSRGIAAASSTRPIAGLERGRDRRNRLAEGRQGIVLSVAAAQADASWPSRSRPSPTFRGSAAAATVRAPDAGRRPRAAQQRQQSRWPALRVRGERAEPGRADAGAHRRDYFNLNDISTSIRTATGLPSFVPGSKRHCFMAQPASSSHPVYRVERPGHFDVSDLPRVEHDGLEP